MEMWLGWWSCFVAVVALLLPFILFSKLLFRKRSSDSSNTSSQSESAQCVLSSASDSSLPLPTGDHEVFLSFRGSDTRNNFADVLYYYLVRSKIRTFRDNEELRKGEEIGPGLIKAITQSKIYIPILSKAYASSKWCLKELAQMVKSCREEKGHIILPIFYFVEPREVRHQSGPYQTAFQQHKKKYDDKTIQNWKDALKEVGELKGWHVTDSNGQGAIVDEVFENVFSQLRTNFALVTDELVGIDHQVEAVMKLLNVGSGGVKIVGIHGMGGIGKTTIAMVVYNKLSAHFDRCCFVEDVREILAQHEGAVTLQKKLISGILKEDCQINNTSEGIYMIKDRVCRHKVLIVLDDVDNKFEFDRILGKRDSFSSGSRHIITTRDKKVLNLLKDCQLYEPPEMSPDHSLQLFSKHAFGMDYPPEDYSTLSRKIVSTAAGLPLAIKVIGSSLFGEDKAIWEETMIQLQEIPQTKVLEKLRISYKTLNYEEQQIFLDIACFFIGKNKDIASYMWSDCKFYPVSGINVLVLRSFIKIGEDNEFRMHDQLRDLGRAIVREENVEQPWKRSRLWSNEDALDVLKRKKGTDQVKALRVNLKLESANQRHLTNEQFEKLSDLRYLSAGYAYLYGDFNDLLSNLRWLRLHYHAGNSTLTNFHLKKLVILDLSGSTITSDWEAWSQIKVAENLKVLYLSRCSELIKAPDFSAYGNLEVLNLDACINMVQDLHISNLKNLKLLQLNNCGVTKLADEIGMLQKLERIEASWCPNLKEVPADIGKLSSLKILIVESPQICHLPASISGLSSLQTLNLEGCGKIQRPLELPTSLKKLTITSPVPNLLDLRDLEELRFEDCDELEEIPGDIWKLSKLETLALYETPTITTLPAGISALPRLLELRVSFGKSLRCIQGLPSSLNRLSIQECSLLERLPSLVNLKNLMELWLSCPMLHEIEGLGELKLLATLYIHDCISLHNLDGLENLISLTVLMIEKCDSVERLPSLASLMKIHGLEICECHCLTEIQGLGELESLKYLNMTGCTSLERLPNLSKLRKLESLILENCQSLPNVEGLESLEALEYLNLGDCQSIERLPCLSQLGKLEKLVMNDSQRLCEIESLESLKSLEELDLSGCISLKRLADLSSLKNLKELDIGECMTLTEVRGLEELESLKVLKMNGCKSIGKLPNISHLRHLETLCLSGCEKLTELVGLEELKSLSLLDVSGCNLLTNIPDLPNTKVIRSQTLHKTS